MVFAVDFKGATDSEILKNAMSGRDADGILVIGPREGKPHWLLDEAILLPADTTVVLQNCKLKLSDRCRDNFFRSANCGLGIEDPAPIENIHIRGEGLCILEGADRPRATGDGGKILHAPCPHLPEELCRMDWIAAETPEEVTFGDIHDHSFGTDANDPNESHYGDWRGIGVLFANVKNFSVSGLKVVRSHGWGLSFEACSFGRIEKIEFDATMYQEIDGIKMNMENQDGIDIRNGCHHIMISDITGMTGDDVVALTAIADKKFHPGGSLRTTHVMPNDWTKRDPDIHDIIIRNVIACSYLCFMVRLLPASAHVYNVVVDGLINTAPADQYSRRAVLLGVDADWGEPLADGLRNITISNVISLSKNSVVLFGELQDSAISNVVDRNPKGESITLLDGGKLTNVAIH